MKSCSIRLELKSVIGRHIILGDLVRLEVLNQECLCGVRQTFHFMDVTNCR